MPDAEEVLAKLAAERGREAAEEAKWDRYRRLCGPPRWFLLLVIALGLLSVVLLFETLGAPRGGAWSALGRIALAVYAALWPLLLWYVENRRRRGLRRTLEAEAPELAAQLRRERLL